MHHALLILAQQAAPAAAPQQSSGLMIGYFILMIGVFYFLLIRPQQRREKERRAMIAAVKSGDRVVFAVGLIGNVTNVKDNILTIKIADNVKIDATRFSISQVLNKGDEPAEPSARA